MGNDLTKPESRTERYLAKIADQNDDTTGLDIPQTRTERYLAKIAGLTSTVPTEQQDRVERYLNIIAENGGGGGGSGSGMTIKVITESGATVTATKSGSTYNGVETSTPGTYTVTVPEYGTYTVTSVKDGVTLSDSLVLTEPEVNLLANVYGVTWDGSSSSKMTRTNKSANFPDPNPYVAGATSYSSPFDNIYPWSEMTKVTRSEGVMVKIPKFWYKLEQVGEYGVSIKIADVAIDGFSVCPACMDRGDGRGERDYALVGRYHCAASTYKSTTGELPQVSQTKATFRSQCAALGTYVWMMDFATRFTIWLLYAVEFADWNSQNCIGYGCAPTGNTSAVRTMGYTDSMPYHTGTDQAERTTYGGTQYRNIEGLWDNCFDFLGSCYNNTNGLNIIMNPASDNENSTGGVLVGLPVSGWIAGWTVSDSGPFPMFISGSTGGSNSTYICDSCSFSTSVFPFSYGGGNYGQSLNNGMFFVNCTGAANSWAYLGSRLLELP